MATKKKSSKSSARKTVVQKPQVTSSMGPTYDTQMIITILLLVFVYPLGLIFMWAWMRGWPVWLKLVISLPFILAVVVITIMLSIVGHIVRSGQFQTMMRQEQYRHMVQEHQNQMWTGTPTPTYTTY